MLTPEYLLHVSEGAENIAEQLHQDILNRIIDRIMVRIGRGEDYILTAVDKWNIEVLEDAGYLLEDIQREIAKRTKLQEQEIREAMIDAGARTLSYDDAIYRNAGLLPPEIEHPIGPLKPGGQQKPGGLQVQVVVTVNPLRGSPYFQRLMQRNFEATMGEWRNFTRTTAEAAQRAFINACDKAYHLTSSGALSYTQAVREALNDIVSNGVYVEYPTGHRDTIETATLRCVRTGISQASGQIQIARMDEMGIDLVLVSSHLGARPSHAEWQGKIFSRSGTSDKYPDFVSSTGYGTVTGLCGANCRHSFGPYTEGMENPFKQYDSEENREAYETQQRQRALERRIRDTKRKCMTLKEEVDNAEDPGVKSEAEQEYQRKSALLAKQNKAYNDFCEENGLKRLQDRLQIAKWDRKQAVAASGAARRYENARRSVRDELKDYSTSMNVADQNKHIPGTDNYDPARSTLTADPQELYNLYAGKGEFIFSKSGKWTGRERFAHTSDIGIYRTGSESGANTKNGIIHYGKRKGWHIVPSDPKWRK